MLGTLASFAGDHSNVKISRISDATMSPGTVFTNGRHNITDARARSQVIITFFRSQRSTSTPAHGARKKPGATRAPTTNATATPSADRLTDAASAVIAI